jgi:hypothetical protein
MLGDWSNKFSASEHAIELLALGDTLAVWFDCVTISRSFFAAGPAGKS